MNGQLNPGQAVAAESLSRPVLVAAGAGSGKTRMLAQRFVNAVIPGAVEGWAPAAVDEVAAITFTDKAAGEIAERVRLALLGEGMTDEARRLSEAWVSTIHGMCSRLLRRHPFEAGVDPLFTVADTVLAGQLREDAFDAAARELLRSDSNADELFERYRFDALFAAAIRATRELTVRGAAADNLLLEPAESVSVLFAEAQELFAQGTTTCNLAYAGTSRNPGEHAEHCRELLGRCALLVSAGHQEGELLDGLLSLVDAYKPLKSLKGIEQAAAALAATAADLRGRIAAALVAPRARAFTRLVADFASRYVSAKATIGVLDFDDLQLKAVQLLEGHPELARRYKEQFRVVMVDEFQDTDSLQLRLVEAVSDGNLCTVGDEKQSIYRFRGVDVDVYRQHRAAMRNAGALVAPLDVSYRSHPELLEFVNSVFSSEEYFGGSLLCLRPPEERVRGRIDRVLGDVPRAEVLFVDSTDVDATGARLAEADAVAHRLSELRLAGARMSEMAVLVRSYSFAHTYARALSQRGLEAVIVGGRRFFELPEIAIMRALTRVIANPEDDAALGVLLASDFVPLTSDALAALSLPSNDAAKRPLWVAMADGPSALPVEDREGMRRLLAVLDGALARVGRMPLAHVLLCAVEESGWDLRLLAGGNLGRDAFANVMKYVRKASEYERSFGRGPGAFSRYLDAKERLGDTEAPASLADDESDAVRIMSIHSSKGLEFPIVAVPELGRHGRGDSAIVRISEMNGSLALALKTPRTETGDPRSQSSWFARFTQADADADAEEDARILYVAFTRAQEFLLASGSMKLQTKKSTSARHDLAKLSRVLGVQTPRDEPMDIAMNLPGTDTRCRVRVLAPEAPAIETEPSGDEPGGDVLPPAPGPLRPLSEPRLIPERLSYTQFSEFERCPRRFWVRRVLGARSEDAHRDGEAGPLAFGTALHAALRLASAEGGPSAERVQSIARYFGIPHSMDGRLRDAIGRFCRSAVAREAFGAETVRREAPFSLAIGGRFFVTGVIDLHATNGDSALVVDYKSGESGEECDLAACYRLQAECYALAVLEDGRTRVRVEFVRPEVENTDGSLRNVAFEFDIADADRIAAELEARCEAIERSAFEPSPSRGCARCDVVVGLCPHVGRPPAGA